jgi:hypothetical protein
LGAGVPEAYAEIQSGDSFSRLDRFVDSNQIYINRVEDFLKSSIPRTTDAFEKFQA